MYKIGRKVVCLTDNWSNPEGFSPIKSLVYTIRGMRVFPNGFLGLVFDEIRNEKHEYTDGIYEIHFWANNFRPVQYDMDINYDILKKFKPVEEKVDIEIPKPILFEDGRE